MTENNKDEFQDLPEESPYELKLARKRNQIRSWISQLTNQLGLNQTKLAAILGVSQANISKMFSSANMTIETIAKLEVALGTTILATPVEIENEITRDLLRATKLFQIAKDKSTAKFSDFQVQSKRAATKFRPHFTATESGDTLGYGVTTNYNGN